MGFAVEQLRDLALAALEEAAREADHGPVRRTKALRFALAYLWSYSAADRGMFDWFWQSLAGEEPIGRTQNVNASLNGIYRALGLVRR